MIIRVSHIGHVVGSITEAESVYKSLFNISPISYCSIPEAGVRNALIPLGNNLIELLEPTDANSILHKHLQKRGEGLYHISLVTDDIEREAATLREKGAQVIEEEACPNLPFKRLWIMPRSTKGILIEIVTEELLDYLLKP